MWKDNSPGDSYDYVEFNLSTGQIDYDVKANQSAMFKLIRIARRVIIFTTVTISVKFNSTTYPAVTLNPQYVPLELSEKMDISNIYLTNGSGTTAAIRIWLFV